jgi:hypothetical protein
MHSLTYPNPPAMPHHAVTRKSVYSTQQSGRVIRKIILSPGFHLSFDVMSPRIRDVNGGKASGWEIVSCYITRRSVKWSLETLMILFSSCNA